MFQKRLERRKNVGGVPVDVGGSAKRPFVTKAFPIDMKMGARDLFVVWISMRRPVEIKAHQDNDLPCTILERGFRQFDLRACHIKHKILSPTFR